MYSSVQPSGLPGSCQPPHPTDLTPRGWAGIAATGADVEERGTKSLHAHRNPLAALPLLIGRHWNPRCRAGGFTLGHCNTPTYVVMSLVFTHIYRKAADLIPEATHARYSSSFIALRAALKLHMAASLMRKKYMSTRVQHSAAAEEPTKSLLYMQ